MAARSSFLLALSLATVSSYETYRELIPNGKIVPNYIAVGHINPAGGGAANAFGKAFSKGGLKWTPAFCAADSDGDGQTNGVELGDPCCRWAEGAAPERADFLSDPGVKTSVSSRGACNCSVTPCFVPGDSPSPSAAPSVSAQPEAATATPSPAAPLSAEARDADYGAYVGAASAGALCVLGAAVFWRQRAVAAALARGDAESDGYAAMLAVN